MKNYEVVRKSKVGEYLQTGKEFFIVDMEKKKVYSSNDLRIREISEKLEADTCFIFTEYEVEDDAEDIL